MEVSLEVSVKNRVLDLGNVRGMTIGLKNDDELMLGVGINWRLCFAEFKKKIVCWASSYDGGGMLKTDVVYGSF